MSWTNGDAELLARIAVALERTADAQERLLAIEAAREVDRQDHLAGIRPERSPVLNGRMPARSS